MRCHTLEWSLDTPFEGNRNEVQEWLGTIFTARGTKVGIYPFAKYPGWINVVYQVTVQLFDRVDEALVAAQQDVGVSSTATSSDPGPTDQSNEEHDHRDPNISMEMSLGSLFDSCRAEYSQVGSLEGLESRIDRLYQDLELDAEIDSVRALVRIAVAYEEKHRRTNMIEDAQASAVILLEVTNAIPDNAPDKFEFHIVCAAFYFKLYKETKSHEDLLQITRQSQIMIELSRGDNHRQADALFQYAIARQTESQHTGDPAPWDESIQYLESSLRLTPKSHPTWLDRSRVLATAAEAKYDRTGQVEDLRTSIKYWEMMLLGMPTDDPGRTRLVGDVGGAYLVLHSKTGDLDALNKCMGVFEEHIVQFPDDHQQRPLVLVRQGIAHIAKFEITGEVAYLEVGARQLKHGLDGMPKGDPKRKTLVPFAASQWCCLYKSTAGSESIETAMTLLEECMEFLPDDYPSCRQILLNLADLAADKCRKTREAADFDAAIQRHNELRSKIPADDPKRLHVVQQLVEISLMKRNHFGIPTNETIDLSPLSLLYKDERFNRQKDSRTLSGSRVESHYSRFIGNQRVEDQVDTEKWIQESQAFIQQMPSSNPMRAMELFLLGVSYSDLYKKSTSMHHLDEAIKLYQQAIRSAEDNKIAYSRIPFTIQQMFLPDLAFSCWQKYDATRLEKDRDSAFEMTQRSLAAGANEILDLQTLGRRFWDRYGELGNSEDMDMSLQMYKQALAVTPAHHSEHASAHHGLGIALATSAIRTCAYSNLSVGLEHLEKAVEACSFHDINRPKYLRDLGRIYTQSYRQTSELTHLTTAIERLLEAIATTNSDTVSKALSWAFLGEAYAQRSCISDPLFNLRLSINSCNKAVQILQPYPAMQAKSIVLQVLSETYLRHHRHTGDDDSCQRAIICLRESLLQIPEADPFRASIQKSLGSAHFEWFMKTRQPNDLREAIKYSEEVFLDPKQSARDRLGSGRGLFNIYGTLEDWTKAYSTASTLFSLIPVIMTHALNNSDKQRTAGDFTAWASDATAVALAAGESAFTALSLLEAGRGLVIGSILGLRSDVDELQKDHSELADEYLKIRDKIDSVKGAISNPAAAWLPIHQPEYRSNLTKELDRVIAAIRKLPGFESFLQRPSEEDVKALATATKSIVIVNVSRYRCDAIIVTPDRITSEQLPNVELQQLTALCREIKGIRSMHTEMLEWLWDKIVVPVLNAIGYTDSPDDEHLPQVCWIPTGPMVNLPLHAAGYHDSPGKTTALDRVISSYSVSLTTLMQIHAYRQKQDVKRKPEHAVLIGMPELPFASKEINVVGQICEAMRLQMPEPRTKEVQIALKQCDILHFAGHGSSSSKDPFQSALILQDQDRLTVSGLFDISLHKRKPFLAFLSACSTGQVKEDKFLDEGLHLIAACQVAGFQHVIGTLWEVDDELCVEAARVTYEWMHKQDMSHGSVSQGLHKASRKLRNAWVRTNKELKARQRSKDKDTSKTNGLKTRDIQDINEAPLLWVPYIHYGI